MAVIDVDSIVTDVIDSNFNLIIRDTIMGANQHTVMTELTNLNLPLSAGVYRITDTTSGATYIGSSKNIRYRISQHVSAIKSDREKDKKTSSYKQFRETYNISGFSAFTVDVLLLCAESDLTMYEKLCVDKYNPSVNTFYKPVSKEFCEERSRRTKLLWESPEYRANAIAARKGNAYNKGYKCTPEQIENRRRAARISNMKRNYGLDWVNEYVRRYPEFAEDVL
jgi:hypothetical protein